MAEAEDFKAELMDYVNSCKKLEMENVLLKDENVLLKDKVDEGEKMLKNLQESREQQIYDFALEQLSLAKTSWRQQAIDYGEQQKMAGVNMGSTFSKSNLFSESLKNSVLNTKLMHATSTYKALVTSITQNAIFLQDFDIVDKHVSIYNATSLSINLKGCKLLITNLARQTDLAFEYFFDNDLTLHPGQSVSLWWGGANAGRDCAALGSLSVYMPLTYLVDDTLVTVCGDNISDIASLINISMQSISSITTNQLFSTDIQPDAPATSSSECSKDDSLLKQCIRMSSLTDMVVNTMAVMRNRLDRHLGCLTVCVKDAAVTIDHTALVVTNIGSEDMNLSSFTIKYINTLPPPRTGLLSLGDVADGFTAAAGQTSAIKEVVLNIKLSAGQTVILTTSAAIDAASNGHILSTDNEVIAIKTNADATGDEPSPESPTDAVDQNTTFAEKSTTTVVPTVTLPLLDAVVNAKSDENFSSFYVGIMDSQDRLMCTCFVHPVRAVVADANAADIVLEAPALKMSSTAGSESPVVGVESDCVVSGLGDAHCQPRDASYASFTPPPCPDKKRKRVEVELSAKSSGEGEDSAAMTHSDANTDTVPKSAAGSQCVIQ